MTFDEWRGSDNRDGDPMILMDHPPRLYWDRYFRAFILPDANRVIGVEEMMDLLGRPG